jgi:hypothetical protein
MVDRVEFDEGRQKIVATTDGRRTDLLAALWMEAWFEARRLLRLPMPAFDRVVLPSNSEAVR